MAQRWVSSNERVVQATVPALHMVISWAHLLGPMSCQPGCGDGDRGPSGETGARLQQVPASKSLKHLGLHMLMFYL